MKIKLKRTIYDEWNGLVLRNSITFPLMIFSSKALSIGSKAWIQDLQVSLEQSYNYINRIIDLFIKTANVFLKQNSCNQTNWARAIIIFALITLNTRKSIQKQSYTSYQVIANMIDMSFPKSQLNTKVMNLELIGNLKTNKQTINKSKIK